MAAAPSRPSVRRSDPPTTWRSIWSAGSTAPAPSRSSGGRSPSGRRRHARRQAERDNLADLLGRRLAVLEELGYIHGWHVTPAGERLARIYHESDLLVAEALSGDILAGAEPSVLAGVVSSLVFERRRARRPLGHVPHGARAGHGTARAAPGARCCPDPGGGWSQAVAPKAGDRLGERRRPSWPNGPDSSPLTPRPCEPPRRSISSPGLDSPSPDLPRAIAAWARGASFGTVLELAALDVGELAPGDFVRTVKQVADLAEQVARWPPPIRRPRPRRMRPFACSCATSSQPVVRHPPLQAPTTRRSHPPPGDRPQSSAPGDRLQF